MNRNLSAEGKNDERDKRWEVFMLREIIVSGDEAKKIKRINKIFDDELRFKRWVYRGSVGFPLPPHHGIKDVFCPNCFQSVGFKFEILSKRTFKNLTLSGQGVCKLCGWVTEELTDIPEIPEEYRAFDNDKNTPSLYWRGYYNDGYRDFKFNG